MDGEPSLIELEREDPFAPHDLGCRCWPHVSQRAAIEAAVQAAHGEYREGLKRAEARSLSPALSGAARIAAERRRQVEVEGYEAAHDRGHAEELARAGATYATPPAIRSPRSGPRVPVSWPWLARYWKPVEGDRIRELEKAGALIAAAIDALADTEPGQ